VVAVVRQSLLLREAVVTASVALQGHAQWAAAPHGAVP